MLQCKDRHIRTIPDAVLKAQFDAAFRIWLTDADQNNVKYLNIIVITNYKFMVIIYNDAYETIWRLLENPECEKLVTWFNWWYDRRVFVQVKILCQ